MAPTAIKISTGNSSLAMPALNSTDRNPGSSAVPSTEGIMVSSTGGRLARMAPKPMGSSSAGS